MSAPSPIEKLPRELAWELIEYVSVAVFDLRLTSRLMKTFADGYSMHRNRTKVVDNIRFAFNAPDKLDIHITVQRKTEHVFRLRLLQQPPFDVEILARRYIGRNADYPFSLDYLHVDPCLLKYIGTCMGRSVGRVEIYGYQEKEHVALIAKIIDKILFERLEILSKRLSEATINFINTTFIYDVNHLTLSVGEMECADPVNFLIHLSSLFQTILIDQPPMAKVDYKRNYMLGIVDGDWESIIADMFSRKLDKLKITNKWCPSYLTNITAKQLATRLISLNRKLWFEASYLGRMDGLPDSTDYVAKADIFESRNWYSVVSIKHSSREKEYWA